MFFAVCCRKFFILENLQTAGIIAFPGAIYGQAAPCLLKYRRLSRPLKAQKIRFWDRFTPIPDLEKWGK